MAVQHTRFTFVDAYGVTIHAQKWVADAASLTHTAPVAADYAATADASFGVVQILHGVGEHSDRYQRFANELAAAGFVVYAHDHRGHGRTGLAQHGANPRKIGKLGRGGLRACERAIKQFAKQIRDENPGLPLAVFAHSWGSLMAQRILEKEPQLWDAVVLSGSAYRTLKHMHSGDLNRGFGKPYGYDWLSRDPQIAQKMQQDSRCAPVNVLKSFGLLDSLRLLGTPKHKLPAKLPMLLIAGSADPLSKNNGLQLLARDYRRLGVRDLSLRIYPQARHELLHETNRAEVVADVLTWVTDRLLEVKD